MFGEDRFSFGNPDGIVFLDFEIPIRFEFGEGWASVSQEISHPRWNGNSYTWFDDMPIGTADMVGAVRFQSGIAGTRPGEARH